MLGLYNKKFRRGSSGVLDCGGASEGISLEIQYALGVGRLQRRFHQLFFDGLWVAKIEVLQILFGQADSFGGVGINLYEIAQREELIDLDIEFSDKLCRGWRFAPPRAECESSCCLRRVPSKPETLCRGTKSRSGHWSVGVAGRKRLRPWRSAPGWFWPVQPEPRTERWPPTSG